MSDPNLYSLSTTLSLEFLAVLRKTYTVSQLNGEKIANRLEGWPVGDLEPNYNPDEEEDSQTPILSPDPIAQSLKEKSMLQRLEDQTQALYTGLSMSDIRKVNLIIWTYQHYRKDPIDDSLESNGKLKCMRWTWPAPFSFFSGHSSASCIHETYQCQSYNSEIVTRPPSISVHATAENSGWSIISKTSESRSVFRKSQYCNREHWLSVCLRMEIWVHQEIVWPTSMDCTNSALIKTYWTRCFRSWCIFTVFTVFTNFPNSCPPQNPMSHWSSLL